MPEIMDDGEVSMRKKKKLDDLQYAISSNKLSLVVSMLVVKKCCSIHTIFFFLKGEGK